MRARLHFLSKHLFIGALIYCIYGYLTKDFASLQFASIVLLIVVVLFFITKTRKQIKTDENGNAIKKKK